MKTEQASVKAIQVNLLKKDTLIYCIYLHNVFFMGRLWNVKPLRRWKRRRYSEYCIQISFACLISSLLFITITSASVDAR